jgi:pimeloyl-ACP methyl ester carboxylesterase
MAKIRRNGIEIEVETTGRGEPLLLIMGLGAQLVHWPDGFVDALVERDFQVIRFDNRDSGGSTHFGHVKIGNIRKTMAKAILGRPIAAPYTLVDMADDAALVLSALGLESAHVVGASMGGMIAQTLAITHPQRVRSLTSIMSTPGGRRHMFAKPRALRALLEPPARDKARYVENTAALFSTISGTRHRASPAEIRRMAARAWARGVDPRGVARQLTAIFASPPRAGALGFVRVPTTVIHGSDDPLILPSAGRATARAIPGARFRLFEGMGHDLPESLWTEIVAEIEDTARRADRGAKVAAPLTGSRSAAAAG